MSTLKRFAGQTAIYGLTNIAARTLNFFLTPIYVKVFAPQLYGIFSLLYSYTSLVAALLAFGMETTYFRFLSKEKVQGSVFRNSFSTLLITSLAFGVLTLVSLVPLNHFFQQSDLHKPLDYTPFLLFFIGVIVLDNLSVIPFARLRAENRPVRYALIKTSGILVFIFLNLFFLFILPRLATLSGDWAPVGRFFNAGYKPGWIGYVFLANLLSSGFAFIWLSEYLVGFKWRLDRVLIREMLQYSWPVLVANLSFIINENADKIFLGFLLPPKTRLTDLGVYSACYKLAVFLNLFIQAFRLGAEPFFFSHSAHPDARKTYARVMHYFIVMVSIIALAIIANISWLKYYIPNKTYWAGLKVVPVLVFGYVCLGIYMNLSIWYKLSDQTRFGFYISGIGAAVTLLFNPLLIPAMGYMGSAWTTLGAYFLMMVVSYLWGQKYYPIPYALGQNIFILLLSLAFGICSFVFLRQNFWLSNTLLLVFILVLFFLDRKEWESWRRLLRS